MSDGSDVIDQSRPTDLSGLCGKMCSLKLTT